MNRYLYSIIRFVPDAATGEFVNIGAVAGSEEHAEWEVRVVTNPKRATYFDSARVLSKVMEQVTSLQADVTRAEIALDEGGEPTLTDVWLDGLHTQYQRILQFSEPTPIAATSVDEALNVVFQQLITDSTTERNNANRTKWQAYTALLAAYKAAGLGGAKALRKKPVVHGMHHRARFDFAVANGHAVQLAQTWSFESGTIEAMANEIKAWAWAVQDIREGGGSFTSNGSTMEVRSDVDIEVLYLPPRTDEAKGILEEAASAAERVGAILRAEGDAASIADRASSLLRKSDEGLLVGS